MDKHGIFDKTVSLLRRYRRMISYLFFGVLTTAVNTVVYILLYDVGNIGNVPSTIIAWLIAVLFAFFTNKFFVFNSRRENKAGLIGEFASFFCCRILTGVLDVAIMAIAVDRLHLNAVIWKLISNIIVTVLNYFASRFFIFHAKNKK